MARNCCGVTRAGRPCSLTSNSTLIDDRGRSVASPLRRGGQHCLFHARPFCSRPVARRLGSVMILLIDLETSGVDAVNDRIVELSAVQALSDGPGARFSTVVRIDADILSTPGAREAAKVHGIPDDEITASPRFPECWLRFVTFVDALLNDAVQDCGDSSDEEPAFLPRPPDEQPILLLAAHNGFAFDFTVLLCECYRHHIDLTVFERWVYCDSLHVFRAALREAAPCLKLQCLARRMCEPGGLQAHRGLDDCVALLGVLRSVAAQLGIAVESLLSMFAEEVALCDSFAQVSVLLCMRNKRKVSGCSLIHAPLLATNAPLLATITYIGAAHPLPLPAIIIFTGAMRPTPPS